MSASKAWRDEAVSPISSERVGWMRAHGVRRAVFTESGEAAELELLDTIPAPPSFDEPEAPNEEKPPGVCAYGSCGDPANSPIVPGYCRSHALKLAGVGNG